MPYLWKMTQQPAPPPLCTVYHDGSCPLCSAEVALYRRAAGDRVAFVDVAVPDPALPEGISAESAMARFHVTTAKGQTLSGARAFVALWASLPRWRWLAAVVGLPGVIHVAELAYRGFLPLRPHIARLMRRA